MITYPTDKLQKVLLRGGTEQGNLPSGFTQVESITFDGSSYIDTGIKANSAYTYKFKVKRTSPYTSNIWGTKTDIDYAANSCIILGWCSISSVGIYSHAGADQGSNPAVVNWETNYLTIEFNPTNKKLIIDGVDKWSALESGCLTNDSWSSDIYNIYLGGTNTVGSFVGGGISTWAEYEVWNGGVLIQRLINCKNSSNVVGMYDTVSGNFLTNAGTGDFTAGPDVVPTPDTPMDIVCNNGVIKAFKTLNISTYSVSTSDASIDITFDGVTNRRIWNTLNDNGTGTKHYENGFVSIYMDANGNDYYVKALVNGVAYNGSVYNTGEKIYTWRFSIANNIDIYCPTINTDGTQEVVTDNLGNMANAEMLLAVDDYKDTQSVLDGVVTRNVGIKVLDGTEEWVQTTVAGGRYRYRLLMNDMVQRLDGANFVISNLFRNDYSIQALNENNNVDNAITSFWSTDQRVYVYTSLLSTLEQFKQFLAQQYAQGTPVIIVYPLATPTTEQVTPQPLIGNTVTQTAGSIDNLPIESSTIAELKKRYIGDNEVKKVYIGDNLVWSAE